MVNDPIFNGNSGEVAAYIELFMCQNGRITLNFCNAMCFGYYCQIEPTFYLGAKVCPLHVRPYFQFILDSVFHSDNTLLHFWPDDVPFPNQGHKRRRLGGSELRFENLQSYIVVSILSGNAYLDYAKYIFGFVFAHFYPRRRWFTIL